MTEQQERRWITVPEFARYLGVSSEHAYRLVARDPDVKRVSRRFGRRVLVCLWAFQHGAEAEMAEGVLPRIVPQNGTGLPYLPVDPRGRKHL
jgi:hypothetical protein